MNTGEETRMDSIGPCDESSPKENGPCIEYLQRAIALLLMKNETMRFELFTVRQRIACIDRTVFGAGSHHLQKRLPSHLLRALRDLCCLDARSESRTTQQPASDNLISFRNT